MAKLAFSTLGCPGATLEDVVELAVRHGATGLELRSGEGQLVHTGLSTAERAALRGALAAAGIEVLGVASYVRIGAPDQDDAQVLAALEAELELARDLGAGGVRVFPGAGAPAGGIDVRMHRSAADKRMLRRLAAAVLALRAGSGTAGGPVILLETHDSHPRGADLARVLTALDAVVPGHGVRVIWDMVHPARAGESPEQTLAALDPWLAYAQIKDATMAGHPELVGEGDIPVAEIAALMEARDGAGGWLSLEWEKAWHPDIPDLDTALAALNNWFAKV
ncbi:sugar phosphate isomerase/epimerase family protein [Arthrobacter sp. 35W]|uniref:sugar phosphate isomerase/epimerase family protein n=1 Tax=Arthrobacter sp. 35W TaxID=1132441 RepID=UPI0003FAA78E|nr:TIM barrel protein [Arthrobacter sp. 35W]